MPNSARALRALRTAAETRSGTWVIDLGQQRVVSGARGQARSAVGVDPHAGSARRREHRQRASRGDHGTVGANVSMLTRV